MLTGMRDDLKAALKARDRVAVAALRSALAAVDNAGAVATGDRLDNTSGSDHVAGAALGVGAADTQRRHLTDTDVRTIVRQEARERSTAAREYEDLGRVDLAEQLHAEAEVLNRYLDG